MRLSAALAWAPVRPDVHFALAESITSVGVAEACEPEGGRLHARWLKKRSVWKSETRSVRHRLIRRPSDRAPPVVWLSQPPRFGPLHSQGTPNSTFMVRADLVQSALTELEPQAGRSWYGSPLAHSATRNEWRRLQQLGQDGVHLLTWAWEGDGLGASNPFTTSCRDGSVQFLCHHSSDTCIAKAANTPLRERFGYIQTFMREATKRLLDQWATVEQTGTQQSVPASLKNGSRELVHALSAVWSNPCLILRTASCSRGPTANLNKVWRQGQHRKRELSSTGVRWHV